MKNLRISLLLLALLPLCALAQKPSIKWMTIEEALAAREKAPKKIVVDMYTDWCGWCKVMDRDTFTDSAVIDYINNHYYAVKLNAEKQPSFTFKGHVFNLLDVGGKSINEFVLAVTNNQPSYPSLTYIDEEGGILTVVPGFQKPSNLLPILKFLGEDKFKSMKFDEYVNQSTK